MVQKDKPIEGVHKETVASGNHRFESSLPKCDDAKGCDLWWGMIEKQGALTKRISSIIEETPESTPSPLSMSFDKEDGLL